MSLRRRMRPIPLRHIRMTDAFWSGWQKTLRQKTLPSEWAKIEETGRLENFRKAARGESGFVGLWFNDSDVYKWIEACSFALAAGGSDPRLEQMLGEAVAAVAAAQMPDGYLNTYFQLEHPDLRWRNLNTMHEMYCAGHLVEAAVAHHQATGDRTLLDVAMRLVEHIMDTFGPGKRRGYCGHQELELALVRLSDHLQEPLFRDYARWMVEERGQRPSPFEAEIEDPESVKLSPWVAGTLRKDGVYSGEYCQDHAPIREHTEVVGHAVRAMYFYAAAAELADGSEDAPLQEALEGVWNNLTSKRMYVTGGIGPSAKNEGFTSDYDLPNGTAYAETCAAIGLAIWGRSLLEQTGVSDYADVMEQAIYNGAISGLSLTGDRFFYTNPLESRGTHERVPWFDCACCPPNIARLIGSIGGYVAGVSERDFYLHIPAGFEANVRMAGVQVKVTVESDYPWSDHVKVRFETERPVQFALRVRIPQWSEDVTAEIEGEERPGEYEDGYAVFDREWRTGDQLTLDLGMRPRWLEANPKVLDDLGRVALTRGPLVYCLESHDFDGTPQAFQADIEAEPVESREKILGGVVSLTVPGIAERENFADALYAEVGTTEIKEAEAKFIPYYAWNNRGKSAMQVWIRRG